MKSIRTYLIEASDNNEIIKIGYQNKIFDVLKKYGYKNVSSKDKIEKANGDLYYFQDYDEIYISYYNPEQIGKIIIFSNLECKLINIDKKANNEIDMLSCDINDNYDKNKFLTDFTNYIGISQKEGTTNRNSVQMAHSSSI